MAKDIKSSKEHEMVELMKNAADYKGNPKDLREKYIKLRADHLKEHELPHWKKD